MADTTFITNESNKKLKDRFAELIGHSKELKFLVGFFYFSGIRELYNSLKNNPDVQSLSHKLASALRGCKTLLTQSASMICAGLALYTKV